MKPGKRGPQRYAAVTYELLAEWVGLQPDTVRKLSRQGEFDRSDLWDCIRWVNERRVKREKCRVGDKRRHKNQVSTRTDFGQDNGTTDIPTNADNGATMTKYSASASMPERPGDWPGQGEGHDTNSDAPHTPGE